MALARVRARESILNRMRSSCLAAVANAGRSNWDKSPGPLVDHSVLFRGQKCKSPVTRMGPPSSALLPVKASSFYHLARKSRLVKPGGSLLMCRE